MALIGIDNMVVAFKVLENGIFLCIPVLWALGIGMRNVYRPRRGTVFFIGICLILSLLYAVIILPSRVSRYLLLVIICTSIFAFPGVLRLAGWIKMLGRRLIPPRRFFPLVMLISLCPLTITLMKQTFSERKLFLSRFADEITARNNSAGGVIYYWRAPDAIRLGNMQENCKFEVVACESPADMVKDLAFRRDLSQVYWLTAIGKKYDAEEFCNRFRSLFYVFPFELIDSEVYRKKRYLLYRFNGKTGDGERTAAGMDFFAGLPQPLRFSEKGSDRYSLDFSPYLPRFDFRTGGFIVAEFPCYTVTYETTCFLFGKSETWVDGKGTLLLYNSLFWPYVAAQRDLVIGASSGTVKNLEAKREERIDRSELSILPTDQPPLAVELPETLYLSRKTPFIFPENFDPASVRGAKRRYEVSWAKQDFRECSGKFGLNADSGSSQLKLRISDRILPGNTVISTTVNWTDPARLKTRKLSLLLIDDPITQFYELKKGLTQYLSTDSSLLQLSLPNGIVNVNPAMTDSAVYPDENIFSRLPEEFKPDAILVNAILFNGIKDNELMSTAPEIMTRAMSRLLEVLHKRFPGASITILLPPPPCKFSAEQALMKNPRQIALVHWGIVHFWTRYAKQSFRKPDLLLPGADLSPTSDYQRNFGTPWAYYQGVYRFSETGQNKIAAAVASYLANRFCNSSENEKQKK